MARSGNITLENNFTKGLITEYTAMNFPENAVTETDNCIYSELGTVTRRPGIDYETGYVVKRLSTIIPATDVANDLTFAEFRWFSVGNDGTTTFVVQQVGSTILFYTAESAISSNLNTFEIDLFGHAVTGVTRVQVAANTCQFTTGDGYLFITHPYCESLYVSYNSTTDTISVNEVEIQIRDIEGVDDGLENDDRPETLSDLHKYNLYNQGWNVDVSKSRRWDAQKCHPRMGPDKHEFPEQCRRLVDLQRVPWMGFFSPTVNPDDGMSSNSILRGNSPAPRGHYIYPAFDIDRTEKSEIPDLPSQSAGSARPSCCEWYAGRVWFAGVKSSKYSSSLYFSQLVEGPKQFGRCYQQNDPTSEVAFDIIDTDGGVIKLPLAEEVVAMKVLNDSLVVLATNCIYVISGTANDSFKTTNYTVRYIGSVGASSNLSVVEAEGALIWWNYNGIYSLTNGQNGLEITNISKQTIQSFLSSIPADNIRFVKGAYNKREQIVRWVFSDQSDSRFSYNRILDLNLASKAFYPSSISQELAPRIVGLLTVYGSTPVTRDENVVTSAGAIVSDSSGTTTVEVTEFSGSREIFKFVISGLISSAQKGITYGELSNTDNKDWFSFDSAGLSYSSYGTSGYRIRGEMLRRFNSTPVAFVVTDIEDGSCLVSGIWDYGARQSLKQELYRTSGTVSNHVRKLNIRGRGKSFQIHFESVGDASFGIVGWSTFDTGGSQP